MARPSATERGPFVPAHRPDGIPLRALLVGLDPDESQRLRAWLQRPRLESRSCEPADACAHALRLLPGVVVIDGHTQARTRVIEQVLDRCRSVTFGVVMLLEAAEAAPIVDEVHCELLRRPFNRARLVAAVEAAAMPWGAPAAAQWHARQLREEAETLLDLALEQTAPIALAQLLQHCADAARHLTGAAFAALFHHGDEGPHRLAALSGLPREAFHGLPSPGETLLLAPTFAGERVIRCDDVRAHPRYGWNPRHRGVPLGHPPVRSYLAVPVTSREGRLLGALLLGHGEPGVFTPRGERLAEAIAAQAAVAIEHQRLLGVEPADPQDWPLPAPGDRAALDRETAPRGPDH